MKRIKIEPRKDFSEIVEKQGLTWHTPEKPYWHESAYYEFTTREINDIATTTEELHQLFIGAAEALVSQPDILRDKFKIPEIFVKSVIDSWNNESDDERKIKCLNYGRFDLAYDGTGTPKLLEYNCDTPTSLIEASLIQWFWKEELFPEYDQFNSIHERLVKRYKSLNDNDYIDPVINKIHFMGTIDELGEDVSTIAYHMDVCEEAGVNAELIHAKDIGVTGLGQFVDLNNNRIDTLFHLYPWEWMVSEKFGKHILTSNTKYIEPIWKMIWSNKAILPFLWELYADHPCILPASFDPMVYDHVAKPILSREGANIQIYSHDRVIEQSGGIYYGEPLVYQKYYKLPVFDEYKPVIGSWCINGYAAGIGIREDKSLITANNSIFTPHIIKD